jgi:hypothetical protein
VPVEILAGEGKEAVAFLDRSRVGADAGDARFDACGCFSLQFGALTDGEDLIGYVKSFKLSGYLGVSA